MPPIYDEPVLDGPLRQGEILEGVWELRSRDPANEPDPNASPQIEPVHHPLSVVAGAACDLEQDHKVRFPVNADPPSAEDLESRHETIPYVHIHALYIEAEIRAARKLNHDLWKRVSQNDNQRYHQLPAGLIGTIGSIDEALYMDFRKIISIPTDGLYAAIAAGKVKRVAVLPQLHALDMVQRYHSYLSRVGLPDEDDSTNSEAEPQQATPSVGIPEATNQS